MKKILLILLVAAGLQPIFSQTYIREWATYFGDNNLWITKSTEFRGNFYLVGKTRNSPYVEGLASSTVYQPAYGGGDWDGFIAKISPEGQLVWFTYYGGTGDDKITDVAADGDALYVVGKTGSNEMVPEISLNGGVADGFVASFDEFGNRNWHTYFGGENEDEVISLAEYNDNLYLYGRTNSQTGIATAGSFQETIEANGASGTHLNNFIAALSKTGQPLWATYYGLVIDYSTSGFDTSMGVLTGIAVNDTGIYVSGWDNMPQSGNTTYYGTPGAFLETKQGLLNLYLSKFSFEGSRLWSTYFCAYNNSGNPSSMVPFSSGALESTKSVTATVSGAYLSGLTTGNAGIATTGVFQPEKATGLAPFIVHFSDMGERLWGSYLGNSSGNDIDPLFSYAGSGLLGLSHDTSGNVYLSGSAHWFGDIATPDGYQPEKNAYSDCFTAKISADGMTKIYGTFYGGDKNDSDGHTVPSGDGSSFYLIGTTASESDMTSEGAWQEDFVHTDEDGAAKKNIFIAKFTLEDEGGVGVEDMAKNQVILYPNPATDVLYIENNGLSAFEISIFDRLGKQVFQQSSDSPLKEIDISQLQQGVYFVKVKDTAQTVLQTIKLVKK